MELGLLVIVLVTALFGYRLVCRLSRRGLKGIVAVGLGSIGVSLAGFGAILSGSSLSVHPYALVPPLLLLLVIGTVLALLGIACLFVGRTKR